MSEFTVYLNVPPSFTQETTTRIIKTAMIKTTMFSEHIVLNDMGHIPAEVIVTIKYPEAPAHEHLKDEPNE